MDRSEEKTNAGFDHAPAGEKNQHTMAKAEFLPTSLADKEQQETQRNRAEQNYKEDSEILDM